MPSDRVDSGKAGTGLISETETRPYDVLLQDRDEQYRLHFGRVRSAA